MPKGQPRIQYRDIQDFPGYRVGDDGSVWSRREPGGRRRLTNTWRRLATECPSGYSHVVLYKGKKGFQRLVHRLVLEAFVGPCPEGMQARHFPDRDKRTNTLRNLSWGTPKQQAADRAIHGTLLRGSGHGNSLLTEEKVKAIRDEYKQGATQVNLGKKYGVAQCTVSCVVLRTLWKHVM